MNILMVSAEMAPFAKVGGLGDVTASLSGALAARGHDVRAVLPLYGHLDRKRENIRALKKLPPLSARVGQDIRYFQVFVRGSARARVKTYLIDCPELYGVDGIYPAEAPPELVLDRWALLAQAALMLPRLLAWPVDIVHAHDAGAGASVLFRHQWYPADLPGRAATVLTIHNLAHQEIHPAAALDALGLPRSLGSYPGLLEYHGQVNLLKGAIQAADRVNTVSPTYARETTTIADQGMGLQDVLKTRGDAYVGILNGIDEVAWNPRRDAALPAGYDRKAFAGKAACRAALLGELGLDTTSDRPLCGFVGRWVEQKGVDLLLPVAERLVRDGFTFALLGTGQKELEQATTKLAKRYPDRISYTCGYDEALSRRVYAGSDLFLMPSRFEPCGLSQMYALRYGTPPVVRRTGGLADTVTEVAGQRGNGFVFGPARPDALLGAIRRAEAVFDDSEAWERLCRRVMGSRFGWSDAATGYEKMYAEAQADQPR